MLPLTTTRGLPRCLVALSLLTATSVACSSGDEVPTGGEGDVQVDRTDATTDTVELSDAGNDLPDEMGDSQPDVPGVPDAPTEPDDVDLDRETSPWAGLPIGLDERVPNSVCIGTGQPPELLSETGCFSGVPPRPSSVLVPYEVRATLWSDFAEKARYLALPDGSALDLDERGDMTLPPGGVTIKTFTLDGRRIETRFMVRNPEGDYYGYSYEWNAEQTDADLRTEGADVDVEDVTWSIPTSEDCMRCHLPNVGISLGLEIAQLNSEMRYPPTERTANQLATLAGLDMLDVTDLALPSDLDAFPFFNADAPEPEQGRAYLHANCSFCHRPGGLGDGNLDLRFSTPVLAMGVCNEFPDFGDPNDDGSMIVTPGAPDDSVLMERIRTDRPSWRMPPLASQFPDPTGIALVETWIERLSDCD
jgi:uncharacterized repeat protein (TIGR03806 family)